jgi:hypothetical protein
MTFAVDDPKATFAAWANLRAPATGNFTYAAPRPLLEAPISPSCIFATPHSAARASACRSSSFSIEMSIPTTLSGLASSTGASPVATFSPFLCHREP